MNVSNEPLNILADKVVEIFENTWAYIYYNTDPFVLDCIVPYIAFLLGNAVALFIYLPLYVWGCPKFLLKYKARGINDKPIPFKEFTSRLPLLILNVVIIQFILEVLKYKLRRYLNHPIGPHLPSGERYFFEHIFSYFVLEITVYYTHRFMHTKYCSEEWHVSHEEDPAKNMCFMSFYVHPIEYIIIVVFQTSILGHLLTGAHTFNVIFWNYNTAYIYMSYHSGYSLPYLVKSYFHDIHHKNLKYNYGSAGLMDFIHQTDYPPTFRYTKNHKQIAIE